MKNPFIPKKKCKSVIISHESSSSFLEKLEKLEIHGIKTPRIYDFPIASHPDLLFHPVDEKIAVVDQNWELEIPGIKRLETVKDLEEKYPKDCSLNIGRLGNYFLSKEKVPDEVLEKELLKRGLIFQSVNQAYVKCSLLYLTEKAFITQDKGIYNLGIKLGFKAYLVPPGGISLPPYDTGFIGGTGGLIDEKTLLFYGDPRKYEHCKILLEILEKEEIQFFHGNGEFQDLGSIIGIGE